MTCSVVIIRDARESIKKCSLKHLKQHADLRIRKFTGDEKYTFQATTLLHHEGPPLGASESATLLLLDSSWRRLPKLEASISGEIERRSIPSGFVTAYPRKSQLGGDPSQGLATIEALFIACALLNGPDASLLNGYHWRESFFKLNKSRFEELNIDLSESELS
jgi:pre-rRNA-processing protein TSR3